MDILSKAAIILVPQSLEELKSIYSKLKDAIGGSKFDCELISVCSFSDTDMNLNSPFIRDHKIVSVPENLTFEQKANIARQLMDSQSKAMVFLKGENLTIQLNDLRYYSEIFTLDPVVGICGVDDVAPENFKRLRLFNALSKRIRITEDHFQACFRADGSPNIVKSIFWATQAATWDKIGGMSLNDANPFMIYQFRASLLGYKIISKSN